MSKLELNPHKSVHNPDFARRNIIAAEIEKVIDALASQSFSRAVGSCELPRHIISST